MSSSRKKLEFHIIAMATYGRGLSGGDRIWIELAKRIRRKCQVYVYLWEEGLTIAKREGLKKVNYVMWSSSTWANFGFFISYFARIIIAVFRSLKIELKNLPNIIVYSASEFWQDSIPALILKFRFPKITWMAAWYQTAPNPFTGFSEGNRSTTYRTKALLYWLVQLPTKPLIRKFADKVIVNNEDEKKQFPEFTKRGDTFVMLGAVDLEKIGKWKIENRKKMPKTYDAVFQGRFHPQKGVVELIGIWRKVVDKRPNAKLAMIGDGPLIEDIKSKIKSEKLEENIKLFGWVFDGAEKYTIFSQSKLVVHPAFYDSGGMASAEAMAFGLPCIGFSLKAYQSYYPKGMIKVPIGDIETFSKKIIYLLDNNSQRQKIGKGAKKIIEKNWSWEKRALDFQNFLPK